MTLHRSSYFPYCIEYTILTGLSSSFLDKIPLLPPPDQISSLEVILLPLGTRPSARRTLIMPPHLASYFLSCQLVFRVPSGHGCMACPTWGHHTFSALHPLTVNGTAMSILTNVTSPLPSLVS